MRMAKRTARMRDVAERAGVGLTTVSRAFSEPDKVSPETLRRIEDAVRDLGYTVNMNARSLRGRTSGMVLVLLPDIGNPFFSLVLKGIEEAARTTGRVILIVETQRDQASERSYTAQSYISQLDARRVDGLLVLDGSFPIEPLSEGNGRYPIVAVAERATGSLGYVGIDNMAAATAAVQLLAQQGHRAIAHLAGTPQTVTAIERLEGYRSAMHGLGLPVEDDFIEHGDFSIASGRSAARRLLTSGRLPTAIFAASDEMAMGAMYELKVAGLRIPDDISVIGFDDIEFSEVFDPPLTTVRQPRLDMGRVGMETLLRHLDRDEFVPYDNILQFELIERSSVGPPASSRSW